MYVGQPVRFQGRPFTIQHVYARDIIIVDDEGSTLIVSPLTVEF